MQELKELIKQIEAWAIERGIDKKGTIEVQTLKTIEEMSELIKGICKDDIELIKDSIGDVFVTLVVGCMLQNKGECSDEFEIIEDDWQEYIEDELLGGNEDLKTWAGESEEDWIQSMLEDMLKLFSENEKNRYTDQGMYHIYCTIDAYAIRRNLTLKECVESAYNEIKNRKGKMIDGQFVKESDLR